MNVFQEIKRNLNNYKLLFDSDNISSLNAI